jgi:hypothetical protein
VNVLETEWWTIGVPPEWWAESEEESILISDRDGVGNLEISTLRGEPGEFDAGAVADIARENAEQDCDWQRVTCGDFRGVVGRYREEGSLVREWYLAADGLLLFITYCCDEENDGLDDAAVDEILSTLQRLTTN